MHTKYTLAGLGLTLGLAVAGHALEAVARDAVVAQLLDLDRLEFVPGAGLLVIHSIPFR